VDPALEELLAEGAADEDVAVIVRLADPAVVPPGVRVVSRFHDVVTCRLARGAIEATWASPAVRSVKAARDVIPETALALAETSTPPALPTDARRPPALPERGRGVVLGLCDFGCDIAAPDFRNEDGTTRLLALWDQRGGPGPNAPAPFGYGVLHTAEAIDRALAQRDPYSALRYHHVDSDRLGVGTHGTHCLSIAAGNGRSGGPLGIAPDAALVFVHLASVDVGGLASLGDSVTVLEGVDFIRRLADGRPWVISLSIGNQGGPKDGSTLVERGLDAAVETPGGSIVLSTGNYGNRPIHAQGRLRPGEARTIGWDVSPADVTPNELECWYGGDDAFTVEVRAPDATESRVVPLGEKDALTIDGRVVCRIYHRRHDPNNGKNLIDVFTYPGAPSGRWSVTLSAGDVVDGSYHCWVERDGACTTCQSLLRSEDAVPSTTLGTLCTGRRTIAVGAYNPHSATLEVAPFSSQGPTADGRVKPDVVAPGVLSLAARSAPSGGEPGAPILTRKSGSSMAAPCVAGTIALMFEAARRPLAIHETRALLLENARHVIRASDVAARLGDGYLDVAAAVAAARRAPPTDQKQEAVMETARDLATIEPALEFVECEAHESDVASLSSLDAAEVESLAEGTGPLDATVAVPAFSAAPQVNVLGRARNAAAITWNARVHPAQSGVEADELRTRLAAYVDLEAIRRALDEYNARAGADERIGPGTPPIDAVLVEAVHQFQHHCFAEDALVDGKAGRATLDSLGLVRRTGLRNPDDNRRQRPYLREKADVITRATGGEFTAATWFDDFLNPSFLGWTFRHGVHPVLVRKLRTAEAALLAMPEYRGFTPRRLGRELRITERHGGSRPEDATASMHTVGLAIDINYVGNPWVGGPNFAQVVRNATLLVSGEVVDLTSAYLHGIRTNSTAAIADELRRRSGDLVEYFQLMRDEQRLRERLEARRSTSGVWRQGESIDAAAQRWQQLARSDLTKLERDAKFAPHHDPRHGFVDLPTSLAVALRDHGCLAWGAVDFGDRQSGDIMHFDCRPDGVGRVLNRGWTVSDGVPCVATSRGSRRAAEELEQSAELDVTEVATDPILPVRAATTIGKSVGRGGKNEVADVGRVQDALLAVRYLALADHTREHPAAGATGTVPVASLASTIAAIEQLQRDFAITLTGRVNPGRSQTLAALNRAIPRPTAAEFTAVNTQRTSITEAITRGAAITHPVGRVSNADVAAGTANVPADVRAVQSRLVGLGWLAATHGESPAAGAAAPRAAALPRTISAIRRFQNKDVDFWRDRGTITGTVQAGIVAPGDATHTLLDRVGTFREVFATGEVVRFFRDFVVTNWTRSSDGVDFNGTVAPSTRPVADYVAVGLTAPQAAALRFVSTHEGDFDALNTFDVAIVSLGFIQFAGGNRSLEPFMAMLKSRRPTEFRTLLVDFGIDVEFNVRSGNSLNETIVVLDPATSTVLRGLPAEREIRRSKKLSAVMVRAARDVEVQRTQIEAATRQFVLPALAMRVQYDADVVEELAASGGAVTATHVGRAARAFRASSQFTTLQTAGRIRASRPRTTSTLGDRISSERGLAVMFDRSVQEGPGTGPQRVRAAMVWVADDRGLADITAIDPHEQRVLDRVLDDLQADLDITARLNAALVALRRLRTRASAPGASVAAVLALPGATTARNELDQAIAAVPRKTDLRAGHFEPTRATLEVTLPAQRRVLDFAPAPASIAILLTQLQGVIRRLERSRARTANATRWRNRTRDILTSATLGAPPPPPP
jgi:hypothetical protein